MKRIAYLGWLGAGNLGDEGCFHLFRRTLHSITTKIACIPITIQASQGGLLARRVDARTGHRKAWRPQDYDYVVLGGGSLLNADRYIQAVAEAQAAGVPTAIWGSGFDGLPHLLLPSLIRGERLPDGARDTAPAPNPLTPGVFQSCRVAGVRGPHTAAWLKASGFESPAVSGDPGLLLDPLRRKAAPSRQIAVIWGMSHRATHEGTSHEALTQSTARWLRRISNDYRPVICAMWSHDAPFARELATMVGEGAALIEEPLTLNAFRKLISQSAATLSYRLHGCIFSTACEAPFCSIAYRSKCYDFAHSVQAEDWVVDPADPGFEERLDLWLNYVAGASSAPAFSKVQRNAVQYRQSLTAMVQTITNELREGLERA